MKEKNYFENVYKHFTLNENGLLNSLISTLLTIQLQRTGNKKFMDSIWQILSWVHFSVLRGNEHLGHFLLKSLLKIFSICVWLG